MEKVVKLPWGIVMMGWEEQSQTQGAQEEEEEETEEWLRSSMRCQ